MSSYFLKSQEYCNYYFTRIEFEKMNYKKITNNELIEELFKEAIEKKHFDIK